MRQLKTRVVELLFMINTSIVSFLNTYGVFILFIAVITYLWFVKKEKEEALHVILASTLAVAASIILKELFGFTRPFYLTNVEAQAGYLSAATFPSIHSSLAFALSTTVWMHQKKLGIVLLFLSIMVGLGRILANVHFPIDILVGAIVGVSVALFFEKTHFTS